MRLILMGNAGAGKSTLADRVTRDRPLPRLGLDQIAWSQPAIRKPLDETLRELDAFLAGHDEWIIEGCYADLIEHALPHCTLLWFLNPGVRACVNHCHARPWEKDKYASPNAQDAMLIYLVEWVKQYEARDDEFGLPRHRRLFETFPGPKREFTSAADYPTSLNR